MEAADQDDHDQHPDFRVLLSNAKGQGTLQSLPSRDAKSAQDPAAALDEQFNAYFQVLSEERHAAERTFSRAVYEPELGLFRLTVNRGTHFVSMGHMLHGSAYLYPEEALYLVDRGSLLVDYYGSDLSVQQMWSLYLSQKGNDSLRMERYLTYAYLKRLGFVVIRPGIYDHQKTQQTSAFLSQVLKRSWSGLTLWCSTLWKTLFTTWRLRVRAMVSGIGLRLVSIVGMWTAPSSRPLIANNVQSCYDRILQDLQIIPTMRLAQSPVQPDFELTVTGSEESGTGASGEREPTIDFEVYKPAGTFKKRQPGIPDYRVVVIGSGASLPSLGELKVMMNGQMDPAQKTPLPGPVVVPGAPNKDKKKKVPDWPKVLFAVVNGGQLSFISMYNIKATP